MKKIFSILLLFACSFAHSQIGQFSPIWTYTGSNIQYTNGSVIAGSLTTAGTLSVGSTATVSGILTLQSQCNGTSVNLSNRLSFNSGDASYRLTATGYGTRIFGYNPMSGVEEEKFAIQASRSNTGANYSFSFTPTSFTNQTASAETPVFAVGAATVGHATGNITTQRDFQTTSITHSATGASTITNSYGAYFPKATAGTNVAITNNYGIGTDGNMLLGNAGLTGGNTGTVAVLDDAIWTINCMHNNSNPGDGTTVYFGTPVLGLPSTTATHYTISIPKNSTLIGYEMVGYINTTVPTAETATMSVRVNNTTDILLNSAITYTVGSGFQQYSSQALNTNVSAGDYFNIKVQYPTYATNPAGLTHGVILKFKLR